MKTHRLKFLNDILIITIFVFTALASFGLGRISVDDRQPVAYELPSLPASATSLALANHSFPVSGDVAEQLVGSKNGSKYHLLTCPGAFQIKEENKVYFESILQAKASGYEPAKNCPGL